jgi:small-conductance mechanosensitive channel
LLTIIVVAVINWVFRALRRRRTVTGKNLSYLSLIRYLLLAIVYISAIGSVASGSIKTTLSAVLASSGLAAVVISIACQEPIGNLCSGVFIILARPFQIGDIVRYLEKDISGVVEEITLRHTVIRTYENKRLVIPNGVMNKSVIENANYGDGRVSFPLDFSVTYDSNLKMAMELVADVVMYNTTRDGRSMPNEGGGVQVLINRMEASAIVLRVWVWAESLSATYKLKSDIIFGVHQRFEDEGVKFAYTQVQVVKSGEK